MLIPLYEYILKTLSLVAQLVKNPLAIRRSSSIPGSGKSAGEGIGYSLQYSWASLVAQLVKKLPAMWETWLQPLGWEDPLGKETATIHYSGPENSMDSIVHGVTRVGHN